MLHPQKPKIKPVPLVSSSFLSAARKLEALNCSAQTATEATSGPLFSEWRSNNSSLDLPELSALFRLSKILPDSFEEIARAFFKPAALTILEVPEVTLLDSCEHILQNGYFSATRSKFDYLPKVRLITKGLEHMGLLSSRRRKRDAGDIPTSLTSQTPTVVLVEHLEDLPLAVQQAATNVLTLPGAADDEINVLFRHIHRISLQAVLHDLLSDLPSDEDLHRLSLEEIYAAVRQPTPSRVIEHLQASICSKQIEQATSALDTVIGLGPSRPQLEQIAEDMTSWKAGRLAWEDITRGVLFFGLPGTGKTFCAQKLASQSGVHFVAASYAEWQKCGHMGDMLAAMSKSFKEARDNAPSILFIDEIDAFGDRKTAAGDNANYTRSVINGLLEQLDGVGKQEGVLVVAACNFPDLLDEALVRSGRFDLKIELPLPSKSDLVALLKLYSGQDFDDVSLEHLAEKMVGCSGADVAGLIRKARGLARQHKRGFTISDLEEIVTTTLPSLPEQDLLRAARHEAGHAVVGCFSGKGNPLRARVGAQGGDVSFSAEKPLPKLADLDAEIATALAGRASEEVFYGAPCAGAGGSDDSDLAKATKLAVSIETTYGLGDSGLTWRPSSNDTLAVLLANHDLANRVETRLQAGLKMAKSIVLKHRELVEAMAKELVAHRELSAYQILGFLESGNRPDLAENTEKPALIEVPASQLPAGRI